jgi:hypothetical protein
MANEFIIREGFSSKSNVIVTGSLTVTSITGSLVTASYGITASYSLNSNTASLVQNITSASYSNTTLSASLASVSYKTLNNPAASYALSGISSSNWNTNFGNNGYISSTFFHTNANIGSALTTGFRTSYSGSITLTPVYINRTGTLSTFAIIGSLLGSPTGSWRVGVYSNSNNMLPETKIFEFSSDIFPAGPRTFYQVSSSSGPVLQQGQIYWLAVSAIGNTSNITYTYLQHAAATPSQNRIFNQVLGSSIPILQNAVRNIAHYKYDIGVAATASALPTPLPQTTSSYTVYSYGSAQAAVPTFGTIHIGPFIKLNY